MIFFVSLTVQINTHPSRKVSLICNFIANLCQLVMFTYSCDDLMHQSATISSTIFSGPWINIPMNKIGSNMRRNLIFIIMRSNRLCYLTAAGFFPVSLETFTAVIHSTIQLLLLWYQIQLFTRIYTYYQILLCVTVKF